MIVLYCPVVFYFNVFFLFAINFVIFNLRATTLLNLNLNLKIKNNKCSAEAEMGDRLVTIDMDRKLGAVPLGGLGPHVAQCGLGRGLPSYQVAS